jgi:hypothetical protein
LGVHLEFYFSRTIFSFRECPRRSYVPCFARGSVLEYPRAVRACAVPVMVGFLIVPFYFDIPSILVTLFVFLRVSVTSSII